MRVLSYGYDPAGERTRLTAKLGATSLATTTSYDAAGRVSGVVDPTGRAVGLAYDGAGERTDLTYPNGVSTTYAYDARGRVTSIQPSPARARWQSYGYVMDAAGNRTRIDEPKGPLGVRVRPADKLTTETVTGALSYGKTFAYDAVGNRKTQITTGAGAGAVATRTIHATDFRRERDDATRTTRTATSRARLAKRRTRGTSRTGSRVCDVSDGTVVSIRTTWTGTA